MTTGGGIGPRGTAAAALSAAAILGAITLAKSGSGITGPLIVTVPLANGRGIDRNAARGEPSSRVPRIVTIQKSDPCDVAAGMGTVSVMAPAPCCYKPKNTLTPILLKTVFLVRS